MHQSRVRQKVTRRVVSVHMWRPVEDVSADIRNHADGDITVLNTCPSTKFLMILICFLSLEAEEEKQNKSLKPTIQCSSTEKTKVFVKQMERNDTS